MINLTYVARASSSRCASSRNELIITAPEAGGQKQWVFSPNGHKGQQWAHHTLYLDLINCFKAVCFFCKTNHFQMRTNWLVLTNVRLVKEQCTTAPWAVIWDLPVTLFWASSTINWGRCDTFLNVITEITIV